MLHRKFFVLAVIILGVALGYGLWQVYGQKQTTPAADPFAGIAIPVDLDEATKARLQSDIDDKKKMYASKPNIWGTWIAIGGLKNTLGDYEGAIAAYKKSLEINPQNILGLRNIAEVYRMGIKDYEKAATYYRMALNNNFIDAELYIALSEVSQYQLKDNMAAEKALLDGMAKLRNHPDILGALISFYQTTGNREKYEETVRRLRAAFPEEKKYKEAWIDVK